VKLRLLKGTVFLAIISVAAILCANIGDRNGAMTYCKRLVSGDSKSEIAQNAQQMMGRLSAVN